jgi:hypothetical protein
MNIPRATYRGDSVRSAIFEEIAWTRNCDQAIVQLRIERRTPEGFVVATAMTQRQAGRLTEFGLLPVAFCEEPKLGALREVTLHPADWAKLLDELRTVSAEHPGSEEFSLGGSRARGGMMKVTRVYDIPVVSFIPGF